MTDQHENALRKRALHNLLRLREPGRTPFRRITPAMEADLLRWASFLSDEEILDMRNIGRVLLRWIRAHQPPPDDGETPVRMIPEAVVGSTFAEVIKRTGWRVELFWNSSAGWFTAGPRWRTVLRRWLPRALRGPYRNERRDSRASPRQSQ